MDSATAKQLSRAGSPLRGRKHGIKWFVPSSRVAATLLNLCAVYTSIGKHDWALQHAREAVQLLSMPASGRSGDGFDDDGGDNDDGGNGGGAGDKKRRGHKRKLRPEERLELSSRRRKGMLAVALHNLACSLESLGNFDDAIRAYNAAQSVSEDSLGVDHSVSRLIRQGETNLRSVRKQFS